MSQIESLLKPIPENITLPNGNVAIEGSKLYGEVLISPDGSHDYMAARQRSLDSQKIIVINNSLDKKQV